MPAEKKRLDGCMFVWAILVARRRFGYRRLRCRGLRCD
jgi:hypothetical protein